MSMLRTIDRLSDSQRTELGIPSGLQVTYKYLRGGMRRIGEQIGGGLTLAHDHEVRADPGSGEPLPCPDSCPFGDLTESDVCTAVLQASLPATFERTRAIALDGTDIESYYVPYPNGAAEADGRVCADPDARWGKRTATDRRPSEHYVGYEAHLATYVTAPGSRSELPLLCAGLTLRAGVQDRAGAASNLVRSVMSFSKTDEVLYDRGYSMAKAENLVGPLHALGVVATFDLHTNQRGFRPGPKKGTIWVDGALFSSALPGPLRKLDPPKVAMSAAEKSRIRDVFTARTAYAMVPHSKPVPGRHKRRFKGPALAGRVRCPNVPASMRRGPELPTTDCVRGERCGCGITISVPDTLLERDRQPLLWQTNAWAKSYNRRSHVEGLNAQARFQAMNINRGYIRMRGRAVVSLLVAIALAGYNATHLHDWYVGRGLPEPWQQHLGEPEDDRLMRRYTRTRGRSRRGPPATGTASTTTQR